MGDPLLVVEAEVRDAGPLWLVAGWLETWGPVDPVSVGALVLWVLDEVEAAGTDSEAVVRWVMQSRSRRRPGGSGRGPGRAALRPVLGPPTGGAA